MAAWDDERADRAAHADAAEADCPPGIVMNCAVHQRTTLNELVEMINKILGKNIEPIYTEPRPGDIKHSFADIERLKKTLQYEFYRFSSSTSPSPAQCFSPTARAGG